jgi:hypothetical protein
MKVGDMLKYNVSDSGWAKTTSYMEEEDMIMLQSDQQQPTLLLCTDAWFEGGQDVQ